MILALMLLATAPTGMVPTGAGTAVKPFTCIAIEETGKDLGPAIERVVMEQTSSSYELVTVVPGTPSFACFRHRGGPLPRGVR